MEWTPDHLDIVRNPAIETSVAAQMTGRSEAAVRGKRQRLNFAPAVAETTVNQDLAKRENDYWRAQYQTLKGKYDQVLSAETSIGRLVSIAKDLAPRSYNPAPPLSIPRKKAGKAQSAVLLLTDTHVGAVVRPDQTLGFGGYDFDTFLRRLKFLEEGVGSILTDHVSTDVPELIVCLGGDLLDGALNHGAEAGQEVTLFQQFYGAGHALAQFLRNVSRFVPKVRIYTAVGNHTRWSNQHKMPTKNRYSNMDQCLYALIQALTRELKNVEWTLDFQPFAIFEVQGYTMHLSHGDTLRGGDKALGIPNHSVARMISSTSQMFGKVNQQAPHYYLTGHLHRTIVLPHSRGAFIVNGGFPGLDGYGLMSGFSVIDPSQTLFFVHPKFGKTATFDIQLKHAPTSGPRPYEIPLCG